MNLRFIYILLCFLALSITAHSQYLFGIMAVGKEFNKDQSLYLAKKFVIDEVLGKSSETVLFDADALAATSTLEVTSLAFNCIDKAKGGLILTFWGNYWNEFGVVYSGYAFKHLPKDSAALLLNRIEREKEKIFEYSKNIPEADAQIFFTFSDITFLLKPEKFGASIRIFWKSFDAEWSAEAFNRTKRRMDKWFSKR
jgi:hypothetical protein